MLLEPCLSFEPVVESITVLTLNISSASPSKMVSGNTSCY